MSHFLTEEQELIKSVAHELAETEIKPHVRELDANHQFPWDWVKRCAELNFFGIAVPEQYGGVGEGLLTEALVVEELSRHCGSLGLIIESHCSLGCYPLLIAGTEEQKQKYLVPAALGEKLMAFGMTEPGSGSDAASVQTSAVLDGEEWVINGRKSWITNYQVAETYIITAKTAPEQGNKGISAFIIEKGTPGFEFGRAEEKLGMNNSMTGDLIFRDCRIPKENLLGELNQGFKIFMKGLNCGRIGISALAVGLAQGAYELALAYAKERCQFGRPISSFQGVSFKLAEMAANIEIARTMLYHVARMHDAGEDFRMEAAMLKIFASEMCMKVCDEAIQIHGGIGYSKDCHVERMFRDAKLLTIGEGTSEICRMIIARSILK